MQADLIGDYAPQSPEWHELRSGANIGGSDVSTILGWNKWSSAYYLWAVKTGNIPADTKDNEPMFWGRTLEPVIRDEFAKRYPYKVEETGTWANRDYPWMVANPDALITSDSGEVGILEIKTAGYEDDWIVPPEDVYGTYEGIPPYYRAQVQWYLQVLGLKFGYLAVLFSGRKFRVYRFEADAFEQSVAFEKASEFRQLIIDNKKPEFDGAEATYDAVRKMSPGVSDAEVELGELGMHWSNAKAELASAEIKSRELSAKVIDALEGAKRGLVFGQHTINLQVSKAGLPFLVEKRNSK